MQPGRPRQAALPSAHAGPVYISPASSAATVAGQRGEREEVDYISGAQCLLWTGATADFSIFESIIMGTTGINTCGPSLYLSRHFSGRSSLDDNIVLGSCLFDSTYMLINHRFLLPVCCISLLFK